MVSRCLSDKGDVESLSSDRHHNLTLCEGDLKAAQNSVTTLEEALRDLQKKESGKLLIFFFVN